MVKAAIEAIEAASSDPEILWMTALLRRDPSRFNLASVRERLAVKGWTTHNAATRKATAALDAAIFGYGASGFVGAGAADPNADPKSAYESGVEDGYNAKKNGEAYDPGYGAEYFSDPTEIEAANAGYAAGFAAAVTGAPKPTTLSPADAAKKIAAPKPKPAPAPAPAPASSGTDSGWLWLLLLVGGGYYLTRR